MEERITLVTKEQPMKFVMLIYQGTTPLPGSDAWKALPEAEQKTIYADYASLNSTRPGTRNSRRIGGCGGLQGSRARGLARAHRR
jgi:hypothetical protein